MPNAELWAVGRLTRDPEQRFTQTGKRVLSFSLATDGEEGNDKDTVWLNCSVWETDFQGRPAHDIDALLGELEQGAWVFVKGRPRARGYTAKDGSAKASLELAVTRIELPSPTHAPEMATVGVGASLADVTTLDGVPF